MFWVLNYFLLCSMPSITPINTPFLHLVKLYSLHLHSHIHEPLAPPPPPHTSSVGLLLALALRGRWPLLPHGLLLDVGLVFLPAGGELPRQGSSTWAALSASGRAPPLDLRTLSPALKVAAVTGHPSLPVSFKAALEVAALMQHSEEMTRRKLDLLQYLLFSTYILIKPFM
jgi:hypothetical protein